ncbi:MAG: FAD-dependent oxidoreductase [Spirochaetota bacterium]
MKNKKVIIIGGVAGGATAAARLRRLDEKAEIIILEKGNYISFANCGLPYFIGDVIKEQADLELMTDELFKSRFAIDVRINNEAVEINTSDKKLKVQNRITGEQYFLDYDNLVLSPGASPIVPPFPGLNEVKYFTLRTIPDSVKIKEEIKNSGAERAVVVGGGFIGLEMAENLHCIGVKVTVVEMLDQLMIPFDREMAQFIHQEFLLNGVELILQDSVESFGRVGNNQFVKTKSGNRIEADIFIMAIGVKPDTAIAAKAGLKLTERGHIIVNDYMQTSNPSIYAVGDAVQVKNRISGKPAVLALAGPANKQGRIAAENIAGRKNAFKGIIGSSILKIFSISAGCAGLNEKTLLSEKNTDFEKIYTHPNHHAGYYPGAAPMTIKLLFQKSDGLILGAQIIGKEGVDKRIDVFASMIQQKATVFNLEELELSYAPPFSSAKDPVNMAGFVAANVVIKDMDIVHWSEIDSLREKGAVIIDVRSDLEFSSGHITGAINIPDTELRNRLNEIPKDRLILVYCQVGFRGYLSYRVLIQSGYKDVKNLTGGYKLYSIAMMPYEKLKEYFFIPLKSFKTQYKAGGPVDDIVHMSAKPQRTTLDCSGLSCPGPIMKLAEAAAKLPQGSEIEISATDPGFIKDLPSWCRTTGNELLNLSREDKYIKALIRKNIKLPEISQFAAGLPNDKAIILFSGSLDKAIAAFIIANGARSMGRKVTMFATFWGLNVLKRKIKPTKLKKNIIEKMFAIMLPKYAGKLPLSQMNMMGMGPAMIKGIMKSHNVDQLETMIADAIRSGVKIIACQMSMDLMGIKPEELIDGLEIAGVASFLEAAEKSDTTLFIG